MFSIGQVSGGSCGVFVHVPRGQDLGAVGSTATYYTVQTSFTPGVATIGQFHVNQVDAGGLWVYVGPFTVTGNQVAVMMHTRGEDVWHQSKVYPHHAANAVGVKCTAA